jgi:hypothetical protein
MMLMDQFMPECDFFEHHEIHVRAPAAHVYSALLSMDMGESLIIRWLFRLRGMPRGALTLRGLVTSGFILLGESANREFLLGIAGRFWKRDILLQHLAADEFRDFQREGFAKAAVTFFLTPLQEAATRVITETRVRCLDDASLRRFRLYWLLVGPFSAWVRREMLWLLKKKAESIYPRI